VSLLRSKCNFPEKQFSSPHAVLALLINKICKNAPIISVTSLRMWQLRNCGTVVKLLLSFVRRGRCITDGLHQNLHLDSNSLNVYRTEEHFAQKLQAFAESLVPYGWTGHKKRVFYFLSYFSSTVTTCVCNGLYIFFCIAIKSNTSSSGHILLSSFFLIIFALIWRAPERLSSVYLDQSCWHFQFIWKCGITKVPGFWNTHSTLRLLPPHHFARPPCWYW
jgi:hypothetical protein